MALSQFSKNLRTVMTVRQISAANLARSIGISDSALCRYLNGERTPDINSLIAIADYFGVSIDWLLGKSNNERLALSDEQTEFMHLFMRATDEDKKVIVLILSKYKEK